MRTTLEATSTEGCRIYGNSSHGPLSALTLIQHLQNIFLFVHHPLLLGVECMDSVATLQHMQHYGIYEYHINTLETAGSFKTIQHHHSTSFQISGLVSPASSPISANRLTDFLRYNIAVSTSPFSWNKSARLLNNAASLCISP